MAYSVDVANIVAIYVILALSLNLLVGFAGLFSVSQGALYGLGAYGFAIVTVKLGLPIPIAMLAAVAGPALAGLIVGLPSLRLSGDYLVIASLGLQTVIVVVLTGLDPITGGPGGIYGIPAPSVGGFAASDPTSYLPFTLGFAVLAIVWMTLLTRSPFGRVLKMVRDDELAAAAAGKSVVGAKLVAFVIGSAMAGGAGALYASYITFIDPSSFDVSVSIYVLTLVIVGGSASVLGSVIGTIALVGGGEAVRFLPLPNLIAGELRQAAYGVLLIGFMMLRPQGIIPEYVRGPRTAARGLPEQNRVGPTQGATANVQPDDGLVELECKDLVVGYGPLTVLRGVSICARKGEIVVIAGHNGAGKSTLLRSIAGLTSVTTGAVLVRGVDVTNRQSSRPVDQRIGLVPQTGGTFAGMTVGENLKLGGYLLRVDKSDVSDRIENVLEMFPQFKTMLPKRAYQLSGGQQRMLSLAMSLIPRYNILLLDEPSIGLSPVLVENTLQLVKDIAHRLDVTVVMCEQNVRPALEVADRAYVLKAGMVALDVSAQDLLADHDLWRLF